MSKAIIKWTIELVSTELYMKNNPEISTDSLLKKKLKIDL